jgi:hypothetical protein
MGSSTDDSFPDCRYRYAFGRAVRIGGMMLRLPFYARQEHVRSLYARSMLQKCWPHRVFYNETKCQFGW